jgi:hypothetical protein
MRTLTNHGAAWLVGACVLGLSACTTYVDTKVTAFSAWQGAEPLTYTYSHAGVKPADALEQQAYENIVDHELVHYGFHAAPEHNAHYVITLDWGTQTMQVSVRQPVFYDDPMFYRGPFWRPGFYGGPWAFPVYTDTTFPVFDHTLVLRITDRASGQDVYKVTAVNRGDDPGLVEDVPFLAHAALAGFPLANGETHMVRVELDKSGRPEAPAGASGAAAQPATAPAQ